MQYTPVILPHIVAAFFCVSLALYARRFPEVPAGKPFSFLMYCSAAWATIYGVSFLTGHFETRVFLSLIMYIPTRLIPPFCLLMVLEYGGKERWITRRNLILLFAMPAIGMIGSLTSPWHTLFRYDFRLVSVGSFLVLRYEGGILYWISTIFTDALLLVVIGMYLSLFFKSSGLHRRNTLLLFIGILLPTIFDILFVVGLSPVKGYSFAPTMLVLTGVCYVFAMLRYRLFGVAHVARSTVVENIVDLVVVFDMRDHIIDFNSAAAAVFGLDRKKSIGERPETLLPRFSEFFRRFMDGSTYTTEITLETISGVAQLYQLSVSPMRDAHRRTVGRLFLLHDIGDLKAAESKVKMLLEEKELLLHEVHHRIKNNMSTMASILSLQADSLADAGAKAALLDARSRIQSMMVLYTKLYISPASGELNAELYLSPLIDKIVANFENSSAVRIEKRFDEFVLDARTLFSLGIIVNELITNAMKHAFVGRSSGVIRFSALKEDGEVLVEVADDGIGLPADSGSPQASGFGLGLVRILLTQLRAALSVEREGGTRFSIRFAVREAPSS